MTQGGVRKCLDKMHLQWTGAFFSKSAMDWSRHIYPSLVLVQPRKTRPYIRPTLKCFCFPFPDPVLPVWVGRSETYFFN